MWHLFGNKAPVVWMRTERPFLNSPGGQTVSVNRYKHLKKSAGWPDSAKWNKKKKKQFEEEEEVVRSSVASPWGEKNQVLSSCCRHNNSIDLRRAGEKKKNSLLRRAMIVVAQSETHRCAFRQHDAHRCALSREEEEKTHLAHFLRHFIAGCIYVHRQEEPRGPWMVAREEYEKCTPAHTHYLSSVCV